MPRLRWVFYQRTISQKIDSSAIKPQELAPELWLPIRNLEDREQPIMATEASFSQEK